VIESSYVYLDQPTLNKQHPHWVLTLRLRKEEGYLKYRLGKSVCSVVTGNAVFNCV